ncbi:MAG TPA: putative zinc-binding peptidase [Ideonella sp.]|nr:putative zinc-binding peptidase [Ideonella sp.]
MKLLQCAHCGQRVFFENLRCEACGSALGFVPGELRMAAFRVQDDGSWARLGSESDAPQRPCQNYAAENVCNWMLAADDPSLYCVSCRTTHIIPALSKPENRQYWYQLEHAKRRLFYTLLSLGLPTPSKTDQPQHGLSFQFLEDASPQQRVLTGHDEGVITLNIAEANDAHRESTRASMHEPYRTLVGHFRHESGHYYWDRLLPDSPMLDEYRSLFGDERADYEAALKAHYANPPTDWALHFVSAYASAHPWEDWAECWAHYLHMVDGLDTAAAWGMRLDHAMVDGAPVLPQPIAPGSASVEASLIQQWLPVSQFVNAMNRSLGSNDGYPFLLPPPVVAKLDFVHRVVSAAGRGELGVWSTDELPPSAPPAPGEAPNVAPTELPLAAQTPQQSQTQSAAAPAP